MKVNILPLSEVQEYKENPRTVSETKFQKLIDSLLVFPKMMELRPCVVADGEAIGGNMRRRALGVISTMTMEAITNRLGGAKDFISQEPKQQKALLKYWEKWLKKPTIHTVNADELTEEERKQFIIKDNVNVGDWDWMQLEAWDEQQLQDWGVGVEMPDFGNSEQNLPEELQGRNLIPDELEKLQGRDETLMQRVIITYKPEQEKQVAELLGLDEIEKVMYKFDELK